MRPKGLFTPKILNEALESGRYVMHGSDPLPFAGEERLIGSYASYSEELFNPDDTLASLRKILDQSKSIRSIGRRRSLFQVVWDTLRLST